MTSRARLAVALAVAVACGGLTAIQSRVNGELSTRLEDGFLAAFISFGTGLVLLCLIVAAAPRGRQGVRRVSDAVRSRDLPWWALLGGLGGAAFVLGQALTVALLGVALFTVAIVCGQTISSLLLDRRGIGAESRRPVTVPRLLGALIAVVAVVIAVADRIQPDVPWAALFLPLAAGFAAGFQQAVNGQVRTVAESAAAAAFISFLVGAIALGVALAIHIAATGWHPAFPAEWWLYTGGALGCVFIAVQAVLVRTTGVLLMGLAILAGQLGTSVLLDVIIPVEGAGLRALTGIGAGLVFAAVLIAALPGRRLRARSGTPSP